ncbi:hypothetical protein [Paenibacillus protaetiae]|uniref:Uncharacterized protein n=1 Tax=Paenibacillus protaetiae TaxID=2509456 RepID=A0A4V0YF55_9BACL|nr:hypothetical protein [Paenibacillus protaetiae]QAY66531.1 hypothetical protein ET464_09000 [Paenibacillus protaetiae]
MNNKTTNEETNVNAANEAAESNEGPKALTEEQLAELIKAVYHNGYTALKTQFETVKGQVLQHEVYGPVFIFQVNDEADDAYVCGFFLRELINAFQNRKDPAMWIASFYVELMNTKGGKPLPTPPANEEETKAVIDKMVIPHCLNTVRDEFAGEKVHAGLDWNEQLGPVFEAGFPAIQGDSNNVCAVPLHLLLTHYMLNRDPSELILQGLYRIREENGME